MNTEPFSTLLIDDDDTTANIFQMIMDYYHLPFTRAQDGQLGLKYLEQHTPSVIVIDIFLPGIDGYHTLDAIKGNKLAQGAACVATTMYHTADTELQLLLRGFDGYLPKPLNTKHIVPYLQDVVGHVQDRQH